MSSYHYSILFTLKLPNQLETLIKKNREINKFNDVAYIISNFDQKLSISIIFFAFAHLDKYEKKIHHFSEKPRFQILSFMSSNGY